MIICAWACYRIAWRWVWRRRGIHRKKGYCVESLNATTVKRNSTAAVVLITALCRSHRDTYASKLKSESPSNNESRLTSNMVYKANPTLNHGARMRQDRSQFPPFQLWPSLFLNIPLFHLIPKIESPFIHHWIKYSQHRSWGVYITPPLCTRATSKPLEQTGEKVMPVCAVLLFERFVGHNWDCSKMREEREDSKKKNSSWGPLGEGGEWQQRKHNNSSKPNNFPRTSNSEPWKIKLGNWKSSFINTAPHPSQTTLKRLQPCSRDPATTQANVCWCHQARWWRWRYIDSLDSNYEVFALIKTMPLIT
jgi:hypothetical protein